MEVMESSITIKQEYRLYIGPTFSEAIGDFLEIQMVVQNSTVEIVSTRTIRAFY